ncbi:aminotransferase [Lederbergia sp. NSJ-179]|uniref:aminotransferase n=1 Tax=Lederbergia sp. NSJ-179 TaxID=2931402 RepID=UPI001FD45151|nr:aminotransferase [Lederbergia sp. NSJ-179]MCJ7842693.1 aminotransferase [Lederbergia sp. NSJ-179]
MTATKSSHFVSEVANSIQPSGIRRFFDLASQMEDVVSLGVGEPDFTTPWNIIEASYHSLEQGYTAYTSNAGLFSLRREISRFLTKYDLDYNPEDEILVTVGASQAIDLALRATIDRDDEVIIVKPGFVSYTPLVQMAGGKPVPLETKAENQFKPTSEQLEMLITARTKAIFLCNPNNPTGTVLGRNDLEPIAQIVKDHDLLVYSDEIYAELIYEEDHVSTGALKGMKERTVIISGFSKAFAMTGWRLGYAAGPKEIIQAMLKIHQSSMMCASTMSQYAGLEALAGNCDNVKRMVRSYRQRRNYLVHQLNSMGLDCESPGGSFYLFPSIKNTGLSSEEFAEKLLMTEKVAVVPGNVFGESGEGYIRCSYATSLEQLEEASKRIQRFVKSLDQ